MALTLAACSNAGSNDAAGSEAPAEAKEILIGISPDYPPCLLYTSDAADDR